ncbi:MAG: DUF2157 domain-containing protein [Fusobacterium sp.]|nr:DUF2157 domain-containing protein [Fusobacterium sp.]
MIAKIKNIFLVYSLLFLIGAITCFTAFNWKLMNNFQKLGVPSALLVAGFVVYMYFKEEKYKNLSLFFSCFMVGTLFATFGQIYQTGADSYTLFRSWAIFLILPTVLTLSYSLFSLLITVSSLGIYFYSTIFFPKTESTFLAMLFIGLIILLYPLINKKYKLEFNNLFYCSLIIPFYILFNFSGVVSYFSDVWTEQGRIVLPISMGIRIAYPIIMALIYFVSVKIYKKIIILPLTIISGGLFAWALFVKSIEILIPYNPTLMFLGSIIIFAASLIILVKNTPSIENLFIKKIFHYVGNFLKILIFGSVIGFFGYIVSNFGLGETVFLILGIIALGFSFIMPQKLNFNKEDRVEFFSLLLGMTFINMYLSDKIGNYIFYDSLIFHTFNIVVFNLIWFFRRSRILDLCFLPANYAYIFSVLLKYFPMYPEKVYLNLILIFGLVLIFLQLILENKNKNNILGVSKNRLNLIFYGNNIALIAILCTLASSYWLAELFGKEYLDYLKSFIFLDYLKGILILILSVIVIFFMFKDKLKNKNLKREAIKSIIILSVIIAVIEFFAPSIMLSRYLIFLILFYAYKQNKWTVGLLNILVCYQIYTYYYHDTYTTLLTKSFNMFRIYGLLLFAYLIIKFFVKEFEKGVE